MSAARLLTAAGLMLALAACGTAPKKSASPPAEPSPKPHASAPERPAHGPKRSPYAPAQEDPSKRGDYVAGGLFAPHIKDSIPDYVPDVDAIPEPEVKDEPLSRYGNRTYSVLGKTYRVRDSAHGYVEEGRASYYGNKFHGRRTSNQEVYDMYAFTAAHKTLPLPSYVRVTNLDNGKSVVVRVNDRGPFHAGRVIDLSYAAAVKLGFVKQGTARVEVRALMPDGSDGRELAGRDAGKERDEARASPPAVPDTSVRAEEFERWMQEKGIRFASGTSASGTSASGAPADVDTRVAVASRPVGGGPLARAEPVVVASAAPVAAPVAAAAAPVVGADGVLLQLASFSARDNAERAHGRLRDAGVESLRIDEGQANGQPVWRLRVGPVPKARVAELSARAADLGFDAVHVVPADTTHD
jgi:rare lipoprotein A